MQTYLNSATGKYHQYEDDVVLDIPAGTWSTPSGAKGTCPTTLTPYTGPWPIPPTLAQAQSSQITLLRSACQSAIIGGFVSSALGDIYTYPSGSTDQINLHTIAGNLHGGNLWCEAGGIWSFKYHTQSQAQMVLSDFSSWLNTCQSKLLSLTEQVNNATTVEAVKAIVF